MTNQHPITPPPKLVLQWRKESSTGKLHFSPQYLATQAARWGADQELEACCEWLDKSTVGMAELLHTARRPKSPTLKEQALTALSHLLSGSAQTLDTTEAEFYIRRALEALPND